MSLQYTSQLSYCHYCNVFFQWRTYLGKCEHSSTFVVAFTDSCAYTNITNPLAQRAASTEEGSEASKRTNNALNFFMGLYILTATLFCLLHW